MKGTKCGEAKKSSRRVEEPHRASSVFPINRLPDAILSHSVFGFLLTFEFVVFRWRTTASSRHQQHDSHVKEQRRRRSGIVFRHDDAADGCKYWQENSRALERNNRAFAVLSLVSKRWHRCLTNRCLSHGVRFYFNSPFSFLFEYKYINNSSNDNYTTITITTTTTSTTMSSKLTKQQQRQQQQQRQDSPKLGSKASSSSSSTVTPPSSIREFLDYATPLVIRWRDQLYIGGDHTTPEQAAEWNNLVRRRGIFRPCRVDSPPRSRSNRSINNNNNNEDDDDDDDSNNAPRDNEDFHLLIPNQAFAIDSPYLIGLYLNPSQYGDEQIDLNGILNADLSRSTNLQYFHAELVSVTNQWLEKNIMPLITSNTLRDLRLTKCGSNFSITSLTFPPQSCTSLERLTLAYDEDVSDEWLEGLFSSSPQQHQHQQQQQPRPALFPNLKVLRIIGCSNVISPTIQSDVLTELQLLFCSALRDLKSLCPRLRKMTLWCADFDNKNWYTEYLDSNWAQNLEYLEVGMICEEIDSFMIKHTNLRRLALLHNEGLVKIDIQCPRLYKLDLSASDHISICNSIIRCANLAKLYHTFDERGGVNGGAPSEVEALHSLRKQGHIPSTCKIANVL